MAYQYGTSPRKLQPDHTPKKKKVVSKKNNKKKKVNKREKQIKAIMYIIVSFSLFFGISYRNSQIDEKFAKVQELKSKFSEIEKQNAQLEITIENKLNLNNLEQQAKELLGMQKLSSKQIHYVNLPKTEYIEPASKAVAIEKESLFTKTISFIANLFK